MFDSKSLADFSSSNLPNSAANGSELDQRLGLYRVFLKLYEHHRELLDEILDLENTDNRYRTRGVWQFVQGVVQDNQVYLITNLIQDKTQLLKQSQQIWVIGRDRKAGIPIQDKRLSRRHAMIQYTDNKNFLLVDLNSTNGTYVNGEPVRRPVLLKDGDRVRLGSLSFIFFLCSSDRTIDAIPSATLPTEPPRLENPTNTTPAATDTDWETPLAGSEKETSMFLKSPVSPSSAQEEPLNPSTTPQLSTSQKADILDRFLSR